MAFITKDGLYPTPVHLRVHGKSKRAIYVSGVMGAANAKFVYLDSDDNPVDIKNGNVIPGREYIANVGTGVLIFLLVENADEVTRFEIQTGDLG